MHVLHDDVASLSSRSESRAAARRKQASLGLLPALPDAGSQSARERVIVHDGAAAQQ